jgi:hypothetical protein
LNEFLHGVSKGFQDAAFASFSRRRSSVREDIDMHFATGLDELGPGEEPASSGSSYLDMLNEGADAPEPSTTVEGPAKSAPKKKGRSASSSKKKGVVDSGAKKKRGRPKKSDNGLTTL